MHAARSALQGPSNPATSGAMPHSASFSSAASQAPAVLRFDAALGGAPAEALVLVPWLVGVRSAPGVHPVSSNPKARMTSLVFMPFVPRHRNPRRSASWHALPTWYHSSSSAPSICTMVPFARALATVLALAMVVLAPACERDAVTVEYRDVPHAFSPAERSAIEDVAKATVLEVRRHLHELPETIVLRVGSGTKVITETGETGTTFLPNVVSWTVDATRQEGVQAIVRAQLRATLFHELHHLVRAMRVDATSLMDDVVREGLATAFERDAAGARVPWGSYPPEVASWVSELRALPADAARDEWLFRHPDGRRWIGLRAGTYLADRAMQASGKSAAELVWSPTDEVIALALGP
jgi:hypothetical protein